VIRVLLETLTIGLSGESMFCSKIRIVNFDNYACEERKSQQMLAFSKYYSIGPLAEN